MAIWILEGEILDSGRAAAVMIDSVTMRPMGFVFRDDEECEHFQRFAKSRGIDDVRAVSSERLEAMHDEWIAYRETHPETLDDLDDDEPRLPAC